MRRGEIYALEANNTHGNAVHVYKNMAVQQDGTWLVKAPKSYAGDRYIDYPDFAAEKWKHKIGRIVSLTPDMITNRFERVLRRAVFRTLGFMTSAATTVLLFNTYQESLMHIECSVEAGFLMQY